MTAKMPTTEKILAEALELHEKGVSLHSIVRTYPEHKEEIEQLFGAMTIISLEKEKVRVPADGLERLLAVLPELEPVAPTVARTSMKSPFTALIASIQMSSLKFVLPIAALALLTGGIVLSNHKTVTPGTAVPMATENTFAPVAAPNQQVAVAPTNPAAKVAAPGTMAPTAAPMTMMAKGVPTGSATDRMVASFSQEADTESTIAQQNDADTAAADSSDKAVTTDPTTQNEN